MHNCKDKNLIIGIMGLFASGKSEVAKCFIESGFYEIDVDYYGHKALKDKSDEIIKCFGDSIIRDNIENNEFRGLIDRKKLGKLVFNDINLLNKLNSIVHPYIIENIKERLLNQDFKYVVINSALLIPLGLNSFCDEIILVEADISKIRDRGKKRDNRNSQEINFICSIQPSLSVMRDIADYIIDNNGNLISLMEKSKNLIKYLLRRVNNVH